MAAGRAVASASQPPVLINSIDVQRVLHLVGANELAELTSYLVHEVQRLAKATADIVLIAANTPHIVFDEVRARAGSDGEHRRSDAVRAMGLHRVGPLRHPLHHALARYAAHRTRVQNSRCEPHDGLRTECVADGGVQLDRCGLESLRGLRDNWIEREGRAKGRRDVVCKSQPDLSNDISHVLVDACVVPAYAVLRVAEQHGRREVIAVEA
jgi:hypothetical protein